jgi:DNA-binding GntR family transcriptional regulator
MSVVDQGMAAIEPGARGGTVDRLVRLLRDGIINNRYAPGQRLIEADLTRDMGVSRGPLREAFRRLAAEGLLDIVPNRGAVVRRLSFREMKELFQIRIALEALAVRCAAAVIDHGDNRTRFETAIAPIWSDAARLSGAAYHEENRRFHQAILDVCGNLQLAEVSRQLQLPLIMLQLSGAMSIAMYHDSVAEHRDIARAILDGDADRAEAALRRHLERAAKVVDVMPRDIFRA